MPSSYSGDVYEARSESGSTAASSMDVSVAPSNHSYASSRDGRTLFREIAGRKLNKSNELYTLPSDDGEHNRLDKQHLVHLLCVGRLYIAVDEVEEALADIPGRQRFVLDLGCGGGNWASSMALEFPNAQIIGVDLAPTTSRPPPPNCRFEFDDFTLGMQHYYDRFDFVHSRAVATGVKDFRALVHEATKCVRRGGVLTMIEGNLEIANEFQEPQEIAFGDGGPGQSWIARMCFEAYNAMTSRGSNVDACVELKRWMTEEPELTDVKYEVKWVPIGPWMRGSTPEETRQLVHLGTLMRQNMKEYARALVPVFLANGYAPELVERFIQGADKELDDLSVHTYLRYHHCWARRVGAEDSESSSSRVSSPPESSSHPSDDIESIASDDASMSSGSYASRSRQLSPGPNAIPIVWDEMSQQYEQPVGRIRFDAESVYSSSLGSSDMKMSDVE